jgi:hypothetical protein
MIHVILVGRRANEMAKALFFQGESLYPPLSLEPAFANTFRVFSKLEVVTNDEREKFMSMLRETGQAYDNPIIRPEDGATLGFAGHWPFPG